MKNFESLIEKYLNGQLSIEQAKELRKWLSEGPENETLFTDYLKSWSPYSVIDAELENELAKAKKTVFKENKGYALLKSGLKYAALVLLTFSLYYFIHDKRADVSVCTVYTPVGAKSHLMLPDSSIVILNSDSKIEYLADFTKKREVRLHGEAYFDVQSNKHLKFEVITRDYNVTVHGTKFNVRSYDNEEVETSLLEGAVSVSTATQSYLMQPNEQVTMQNNRFVVEETNVNDIIAWKDNHFVFKSESLSYILKRFERQYGIKVTIKDSTLNDVMLSGGFRNNETPWQILDGICLSADVIYERTTNNNVNVKRIKPMEKD